MTVEEFRESALADEQPDASLPLIALWFDARGDWHGAHEAAQADDTEDGAWVHAYLHRKEGDLSNAGYWYRRAGKSPASGDLDAEWDEITAVLLKGGRT
jgi:hypothetical protein